MSVALNDSNSFKITCVVTKGPHKGQSFVFSKELITVGRGQENDIVLVNDPMVSRNHCHITVANNEVEIHNLSQKNTLIIEGESVQRWKLLNSSFFSIGDTEITLEIDFGARVVQQDHLSEKSVVKDDVIKKQLVLKKPKLPPPQAAQTSQIKSFTPTQDLKNYQQPFAIRNAEIIKEKPIAFYVILAIVALAAIFLVMEPNKSQRNAKEKKISTLKYEDEVVLQLNSKNEKQVEADLRRKYEQKNSAMALRAEENFMKGMREFQLGQYARAQEFLQVVLNLNPGHDVAAKYLKLARIRFDEVLKAKLVLGEISYQKHNFRMCASQYLQIMNMLEGRNRDETYRLAESWYKKCEYAAQGIM